MGQQTITTHGAGTFTVPANVFSLTIEAWGGGGGGTGTNSVSAPGGGGGGYSMAVVSVIPNQTVFFLVGGGGIGSIGLGAAGGTSWINPAANSQPSSNGVVAGGGGGGATGGSQAGGAGSVGTLNFTGGASGDGGGGGGGIGGGGGGGAGSAGNGQNGTNGGASGGAGGAGGSPDGGAGSNGVGSGTATDGRQPGGGGGGAWAGTGGGGGDGQVRFTWVVIDQSTTLTNKHGRYFSRKDYKEWLARIVGENEESRREYQRFIDEAEAERNLTYIERADRDYNIAEEQLANSEDALFDNLTETNHIRFSEAQEKLAAARKERDHQYFMDIVNKEWAKYNESKKK